VQRRVPLLVASYCRANSIKLLMPSINTHRSLGKRWHSIRRGERCISGYDTLEGCALESSRVGVCEGVQTAGYAADCAVMEFLKRELMHTRILTVPYSCHIAIRRS